LENLLRLGRMNLIWIEVNWEIEQVNE
jgi:hypothetical protein